MIDKRMLCDTVNIQKVESMDEWSRPIYDTGTIFRFVRFDNSKGIKGTADSREKQFTGIIFMYKEHTTNFGLIDESYLNALVTYNNSTFVVTKIIPLSHWTKNEVIAYEIEVV